MKPAAPVTRTVAIILASSAEKCANYFGDERQEGTKSLAEHCEGHKALNRCSLQRRGGAAKGCKGRGAIVGGWQVWRAPRL